jgi:hypothetical protein
MIDSESSIGITIDYKDQIFTGFYRSCFRSYPNFEMQSLTEEDLTTGRILVTPMEMHRVQLVIVEQFRESDIYRGEVHSFLRDLRKTNEEAWIIENGLDATEQVYPESNVVVASKELVEIVTEVTKIPSVNWYIRLAQLKEATSNPHFLEAQRIQKKQHAMESHLAELPSYPEYQVLLDRLGLSQQQFQARIRILPVFEQAEALHCCYNILTVILHPSLDSRLNYQRLEDYLRETEERKLS